MSSSRRPSSPTSVLRGVVPRDVPSPSRRSAARAIARVAAVAFALVAALGPPGGASDARAARFEDLASPCKRTLPGGSGAVGGRLLGPPTGACAARAAETAPVRLLVFTRTTGFRHDSIADAWAFFEDLRERDGVSATISEDPAVFDDATLADFDVVAFVNTTGDVLDEAQQAALERFIRRGRGFVGVHSAADTEYQWPFYGRLVGAYFISHPILPVEVEVTTEDHDHPSTRHLPDTFDFTDEIYNFDRNPRFDNDILLTVDEAGFIYPNFPATRSMGFDHPIAWYKDFEGGRSFYTNLGHRPETWRDPAFQQHLLAGIVWAAEPASYSRIVVTDEARNPIHLAVAPDGNVFYVERTGEVRVWSPRSGRVVEALRLEVSTSGENGLMGVAVDPDYAREPWVYLYYALDDFDEDGGPPPEEPQGTNVLARYRADASGILDPASRELLLEVPSDRTSGHEGGGLAFAPDGTLFVAIGDNTDPFGDSGGYTPIDRRPGRAHFDALRTSANPHDLRGKILRLNKDGSIPPGNLFTDPAAGRPEIFVMGNRNPYRVAVDPVSGRLFWGEVGPDALVDGPRGPRGYDEINFADRPGHYGWPFCIGPNIPYPDYDYATGAVGELFSCAGMTPPLFAYDYFSFGVTADPENRELMTANGEQGFTGRTAIAGAVLAPPRRNQPFALPPEYAGSLLMTDWTRDLVAAVTASPSGKLLDLERLFPWIELRRPIDLEVGPDGALYVLEYGSSFGGDNDDARVSRIEHSATGELTPVAELTASRTAGHAPLAVAFSAEGSRAPGAGDRVVAYEWDFDFDGRPDAEGADIEHTFAADGVFPVALTVVGASGRRSFPVVREIVVGNQPPVVRIESPADGAVFAPGTAVTFRGSATDTEDGAAPCSDLEWDIRLGHNAHSHPRAEARGCEVSFVAQVPSDHADVSGNTFFVIELSYADRGGNAATPSLTGRSAVRFFVR